MAHSKLAIYGATGASVAIAVMKSMVAGITGSSAMLSEGVHSAADTQTRMVFLRFLIDRPSAVYRRYTRFWYSQ